MLIKSDLARDYIEIKLSRERKKIIHYVSLCLEEAKSEMEVTVLKASKANFKISFTDIKSLVDKL